MAVQEPTGQKSDLLLKVVDEQNIESALALIRDVGRYANIVYHLAFRTNAPTDMPYIKSTYSPGWLGHYIQNQYQDIDPVIHQGFKRDDPFFWSQLDLASSAFEALFDDAKDHGAGSVGFSIPLTDRSKRKAMFSVTGLMPEVDWQEKISAERRTLEQLGDVLHRKAILQIYGTDDAPVLAPREIECLYWTAQGKDIANVGDILNISEHTARDYLKSARLKLSCRTTAQAIHQATRQRLINF